MICSSIAPQAVVLTTAQQDVGAKVAMELVAADLSFQRIVAAITETKCLCDSAGDVLDARELVTLGIAAPTVAGGQIDPHPGAAAFVRNQIAAGGVAAAVELIGVGSADEKIVAITSREDVDATAAAQNIVPTVPGDRVAEAAAGDVLDAFIAVACGEPAAASSGRQIDHNPAGDTE